MKKYRVKKKKSTGFGALVDFVTGESLKEAIEGPFFVEAETEDEARQKGSEKLNIPLEDVEVEEVK